MSLFADDSTISISDKSLEILKTKIQHEADNFDNWCCHNHMIINTDKTKGMLLTTHAKRSQLTDEDKDLNITMRGKEIKNASEEMLLGVIIDSSLSWKAQIQKVSHSILFKLSILRKICKYLPTGSEFYIIITTSSLTFYTAALYGASVVKKTWKLSSNYKNKLHV